MTDNLATFDHRRAMRHVRSYAHPIERVWEAVTTPAHMDLWMLPKCQVDPRLGGECRFTWGGDDLGEAEVQHIVAWDPPRLVDYGGGLRFELEALTPQSTRLTFIHSFAKDVVMDPMDGEPGGGLPGGPDTPWRPGFAAGFHVMLDDLARHLEIPIDPAAVQAELDAIKHGVDRPRWLALVAAYETHIRDTIPAK